MKLQVVAVFAIFIVFGKSADRGDECTDQFGEKAICTNIQSCNITLMNATIGERIYISGVVCGFDGEPLVCCQTPTNLIPLTPTTNATRGGRGNSVEVTSLPNNKEDTIFTSPPLIQSSTPDTTVDLTINNINSFPNSITESEVSPVVLPLQEPNNTTNSPISTILRTAFANTSSSFVNTNEINKLLPDRHTCGLQSLQRRLQNPALSSAHEFPWTVLLKYSYGYGYNYNVNVGYKCVGTLISDRYVVTAAQCVPAESEYYNLESVRLGEWIISATYDCAYDYSGQICADSPVDVGIQKVIVHRDYDRNSGLNNIALIQLDRDVKYSDFIRPICLPVQDLLEPEFGTILVTAGWGVAKYGNQLDIKSKINLPVLQRDSCVPLSERQVCLGTRSTSDLCLTDAGGALMAVSEDESPQWYLEGIIADGFACNQQNAPGVYTRVNGYVKWILDAISQDSQ